MKCQANLAIAGSPRNAFRGSVEANDRGGRALTGYGGEKPTNPYQTANATADASAVRQWGISSIVERETAQTAGQGPQISAQWERKFGRRDNQEVGLEAAILERVRNSSLVEWPSADNSTGLKRSTEAAGSAARRIGRGAFRSAVKARPRGPLERAEVRMPV